PQPTPLSLHDALPISSSSLPCLLIRKSLLQTHTRKITTDSHQACHMALGKKCDRKADGDGTDEKSEGFERADGRKLLRDKPENRDRKSTRLNSSHLGI